MKATEQLTEEHQAVVLTLNILEIIIARLSNGKKVDPNHLEQIIDFFQGFVDRCHHTKEEKLLFPKMQEYGLAKEGGPISVMLLEHERGRDLVKNLKRAVDDYRNHKRGAAKEIVSQAQKYVQLLNDHIQKEDNILFPMADIVIPQLERERLWKGFEEVENKEVGKGKHEAYHQILDQLKSYYLKPA
jgi:hemerythrin-like domain-containing protein